MARYVAFLRAINVGGRVVTMAELRQHFEALGLADVTTFIASGNVIFTSRATAMAALERRIAKRLATELGYEVPIFIRSGEELALIARQLPFSEKEMAAAKTFVVGLLAEPLGAVATKSLMALATKIDRFHVDRREIYWVSQNGQSDSVISNVALERALKVRSTFRGMNTMVRLVAKYGF